MSHQNAKTLFCFPRHTAQGAGSRVRFFNYFPYLEKHIHIETNVLLGAYYLKALYTSDKKFCFYTKTILGFLKRFMFLIKLPANSIIWLEKDFFPYLPFLFEKIFFKKHKIILELDDAWHLRYKDKPFLNKKMSQLAQSACHVIAANPYVEAWAKAHGQKNVTLIPSTVQAAKIPKKNKRQKKEFVIGWIGTPSTQKYLEVVKEPLKEITKKYNNIHLLVMGGHVNFKIPNLTINHMLWSLEQEPLFMEKIDVGIMPLLDTEWEKYKSGYKLLQYMSYGKPVIGSPVGVNVSIIEHEKNGFTASTKKEWVKAIETLYINSRLADSMGAQCQKKARNYETKKWASVLVKIIRNT